MLVGPGQNACPAGYLCAWEDTGFTGRGVAIFGTESHWGAFPERFRFIDNTASSFFNNGVSERGDVRLGRLNDLDIGAFVLCNGDAMRSLGEGRDDGALPGQGWNDQVSSNQWFDSYWCS